MIPVVQFPKRCPHCRHALAYVRKIHASWLECRNPTCPFWLGQDPLALDGPDPLPYTYAFTNR